MKFKKTQLQMHEIDDPLIEIGFFHDRIFLLGVDQLLRGGYIAGFEYQLLFLKFYGENGQKQLFFEILRSSLGRKM